MRLRHRLRSWVTLLGTAAAGTAQWSHLPPLPDPVGVAGAVVGVHGDVLLVGGGANFPAGMPWAGGTKQFHERLYALPAGGGRWLTATSPLPQPTAYGVSVSTDAGVVVVGGRDATSCHAATYRLRWHAGGDVAIEPLPPLPRPLAHAGGAVLGSRIYVCGGQTEADGSPQRLAYRLDLAAPAAGWQALPRLPGPRRGLPVVVAANQSLYVFSGRDYGPERPADAPFAFHADWLRFDPHTEQWTEPAPLRVDGTTRCIMAGTGLVRADRVLLFGGADGRLLARSVALEGAARSELMDRHPGFSRDVLAFHPGTGSFEILARLAEPDRMPVTTTAVWFADRIVLPSGEVSPGRRTAAVLAFDAGPSDRTAEPTGFGAWNWLALAVYLLSMVWIGVRCSRRIHSSDEFFLAGRRIPWWAAGLSIFGTQLSAITFMAIPATTYGADWVRIVGQVMILMVIPIVVFSYLPIFRGLQLATAYQYLERRFGAPARLLAATLFVLLQLGRMGVVMYLPALALAAATGLSATLCIVLMGGLSIVYTVLGGLEAVIWTDVVQVFVLVGGALIALVTAISAAGGVSEVVQLGLEHDKLRVVADGWSLDEMSLPVMVVGFFFLSLIPYTTDQSVVQRYMATPSQRDAARGLWANFAITLPIALLFFGLGTALFAFYRTHPTLPLPAVDDQIVPWFVVHQLPAGIAGMVIAAIFAASMSSLDSAMNSVSTVLVRDFYQKLRPDASDARQLHLGRLLTVLLGVLGTTTALGLASLDNRSLFDTFNTILGFFGGALAGLFFLAVFCRWATPRAAVAGTVLGAAAVGACQLAASLGYRMLHPFLYGAVGFGVCVVAARIGSPRANR